MLNDLLSGVLGFIPSWLAFYVASYLLGLDGLAIAIGTMLLVPFYIAVRYGARYIWWHVIGWVVGLF